MIMRGVPPCTSSLPPPADNTSKFHRETANRAHTSHEVHRAPHEHNPHRSSAHSHVLHTNPKEKSYRSTSSKAHYTSTMEAPSLARRLAFTSLSASELEIAVCSTRTTYP
jgi:hypothetical protein